MIEGVNRRVLIVDDTVSIHEDFRKILGKREVQSKGLTDMKSALFGAKPSAALAVTSAHVANQEFEIEFASQGQEALEKVKTSLAENKPFAVVFMDVRMPPGMDGIQTLKHIWQVDPQIQAVLCTAFSDYSWEQTINELGQSDRLLIVKKPFEPVEVCQLATAFVEKWNVAKREQVHTEQLKHAEQEARAYASSLETVNRALITAKASAESSSQMKTDFLLHLNDQIHSSLNEILNQASGLSASGDSKTSGITQIIQATQTLLATFHETLDITLMESGNLKLGAEPCCPIAILRDVIKEHREVANSKQVALELEVITDLPEQIHSDAGRLRQVISELVRNAVTHTSAGCVKVTASLEQTNDWRRPLLRCDISDTGCGIPKEIQGKIFEPFFSHQSKPDSKYARAGLGLTVAKQLSQLLGGDLHVDETSSEGTTFTLRVETGSLEGVKLVPACAAAPV